VADLKQTPLHQEHVQLGARMVDFGGWSMPVQYRGILEEHHAVRSGLGVFDISHMGQFSVHGTGAQQWLDGLLTNNVAKLEVGECHYTFLLNERGGVIDDLILYRIGPAEWLLVVNASKIEEDFAWLQQQLARSTADVQCENVSAQFAGFAVQGRRAVQLFDAFFDGRYSRPARNEILRLEIDGALFYIARTGYTGEDGFEVFCPADRAVDSWRDILERGAAFGIQPCGLGARDTLRLEMCYPLNGADLTPETTPLEAGLSIFVDLQKPGFIGQAALQEQKQQGVKRRLVPFKVTGSSPPPRPHYAICKGAEKITEATSGTLSPSLKTGIGMAYVPADLARIGEELELEIRGKRFPIRIEKKPLYTPEAASIPLVQMVST